MCQQKVRRGIASSRSLTYKPYSELCVDTPLAGLLRAPTHAIARLAEPTVVQPSPPIDLAGVVDPKGPTPSKGGEPAASRIAESWWTAPFHTPDLYGACLHQALCVGGRIRKISHGRHESGQLLLVDDRVLVDDSYYVRDRSRSLPDDLLGERDGRLSLRAEPDNVETRSGTHYLIGSAHGHFGHFLLEGLSRLWLLDSLDCSDLHFVVYEPELVRWQLDLLAAAGVPEHRIVCVERPTRFERLIVPSRAYNLHRSSSGAQDRLWQRIGESLDEGGDHGGRVYLSRSEFRKRRALRRETEIERVFADRGFSIVHTQKLPVARQVALARGAEHIAGSAGSAMYLGAFQPEETAKLIISPSTFCFRDDQLISHFRGGQLAYYMSHDIDAGDLVSARHADYSVDVPLVAEALDRWLTSGERGAGGVG